MALLKDLPAGELQRLREQLHARYEAFRQRGLHLDITRGKPCAEQLDLSNEMLRILRRGDYLAADGTDCRNYGGLRGLPEARELFAAYLDVEPAEMIVAGNSSLELMHCTVADALAHGVPGSPGPWRDLHAVRWLCPVPGYDRHFAICEHQGIQMIPVPMRHDGPDMDAVESLAGDDVLVKGIWCVPKYHNPTGVTFSDEVVEHLASMRTAAPDFRILWDNAYAVHHIAETLDPLRPIMAACRAAGHADRALTFGSTSKITFAGAGLGLMAGSEPNIAWALKHMGMRTIGPDKLNQLRHVRFLQDMNGLLLHMQRHAALVRPRFEAVRRIFEAELGGRGIAEWTNPRGGYFVSVDVMDACAREVVQLAHDAGVRVTPAGATFPYRNDPRDRNIRLAPTLPPLDEVREAVELLAVCIQLAAVGKLLP